jgi:polysaccharide biosynthesis protein PslH
MRVVLLSPELPFAPGGSGGSTRQYQLMRALRADGADVAVVAPVHPSQRDGAERLVAEGVETHLVQRPAQRVKEVVVALRERPELLPALVREPLLAWQVDVFWTRLRHRLDDAVAAGRPDVILIDHDWAANWHPQLPAGVPRALTLQNLTWRYYRGRAHIAHKAARAVFALEARRWLRYDRRHLRHFDLLIAMSEQDAAIARSVLGVCTVAVPNGVDTAALRPAPPPPDVAPVLLYTGTMSYPPNAEGLRWLLDTIWPRIRAGRPDARLVVVGKDPPVDPHAVVDDGVTIAGWVPDMAPYFAEAAAVLVPILSGGGTRLKVLDGLASGRPVVSTATGAEGIAVRDGEHALLADDASGFAAAALRVLADPALAQRVGAAGRRLVEEEYDWTALGARLAAELRRLARP